MGMAALDFNRADFTLVTARYPMHELKVLRFAGREQMSRLFEFDLELVSELPDIDLDAVIGQPALLTLRGLTGERHVHGVVEWFEHQAVGRKFSHYAARLVPSLVPLRYRHTSRIFQKKSVPDIVKEVVTGAGLPAELLQPVLQGSYAPRDFCVQYQESDLAFISRLLEEEGIFFYFEHFPERDVMVLGDHVDATELLPTAPLLNFRDESRAVAIEEEHFHRFEARASIRSGKAMLRDYRFRQPRLDMDARASASSFTDLEWYHYPGEYVDPDIGADLVKVRLEELQQERHLAGGVGTSRAVVPGYRFMLELHPRPDFNREYLILSVEHRGVQPGVLGEEQGAGQVAETAYSSRVGCLPSDVPYRPARVTPRPAIPGVQSAVVVGPGGEEIHCDEFGRVAVQFHWDREGKHDDHSSCWIRVSQPWAGSGYGGMWLPRVGQEVLVQFLEGDPDRPVIVGRVYNGDNRVPYDLPTHKTRSTFRSSSSPGGGGYNELRFEDKKGSEEVFLHAQKDLNEVVEHCHSTKVKANQSNSVGGSQTVSVGGSQTTTVHRDRKIEVTEGNEETTIKKGNCKVTLDKGTYDLKAKDAISIETTAAGIKLKAATEIVLEVGGSKITMTPGSITIESAEITDKASGVHTILGQPIKLNC